MRRPAKKAFGGAPASKKAPSTKGAKATDKGGKKAGKKLPPWLMGKK